MWQTRTAAALEGRAAAGGEREHVYVRANAVACVATMITSVGVVAADPLPR